MIVRHVRIGLSSDATLLATRRILRMIVGAGMRSYLTISSFDLIETLPLVEISRQQRRSDQSGRHERGCNEALLIVWSVSLLPHYQRQPCLENVGELIHACNHHRSLFLIVSTDLVRPCHAEAGETSTSTAQDIARPSPAGRNSPDCQRHIADYVDHPTKYDRWPSRSIEY